MRECLDDAMLQSYFDGELSTQKMESATLHLASCVPCAAAARELEQEILLLDEAFAAEFEAAVPSERLRMKVEAAVAGLPVVSPVPQQSPVGFFSSLFSFLSFSPQRTLGYASLALILAAAGILGIVKLRTTNNQTQMAHVPAKVEAPSSANSAPQTVAVANSSTADKSPETMIPESPKPQRQKVARRTATPRSERPVELIPGERSYLQTIARLDSTIKSQRSMRPALQVEYERNLAVVDRAIAATRSAAKSNPNDPDAADFMFAAYQSKVDLLNTIADARLGGRSH